MRIVYRCFLVTVIVFGLTQVVSAQNERVEFVIKGVITDASTGKSLEGTKVELIGSDDSHEEIITSKNGKYEFDKKSKDEFYVKPNLSYKVVVSKEGYLKAEGEESTKDLDESVSFELDFSLEKANKE